jgi:hypothetical protein
MPGRFGMLKLFDNVLLVLFISQSLQAYASPFSRVEQRMQSDA